MKVKTALAQALAIALLSAIAFSGSLDGEFVSDDTVTVRDNELIRTLDWPHLQGMLTTFDGANYVPLKVLSFALDYRLWGPAPFGFHATNIAIHILCALMVLLILVRLGVPQWPAFFVTLLWSVHPLQVESVAWISERKNVLSGLFFFAAFYAYLGFTETGGTARYFSVLLLFALAVLSKMNTMVLPAVCLSFELTFHHRLRRRDLLAALPLFAIAAAVGWYNLAGNPIHGTNYHGGSALVTWLSSSVVVFRYLWNLLLPTELSVFYEVPLRDTLFSPPVFLSVTGLLAAAALTGWLVRKRRQEAFWILWFGITLSPMLNIIPFRSLMNDRYMYIPMLGPLVLLGGALAARKGASRRAAYVAAVLAVMGCTYLSLERTEVWGSPLSMWKDWVSRFHYTAADPVYVAREYDAKVAYLRELASREPTLAAAHNNLGGLYYEAGRLRQAVKELELAAELDPTQAATFLNLGRAYARLRDLDGAARHLKHAVRLAPYSFLAHLNLARVYLARGDVEGARAELEACHRIRPPSSGSDPFWKRERDYLRRLEAARGGGEKSQ